MNIGVIGASGYAGGELLRLLSAHTNFKLTYISANTNAGELITSVHPQLFGFGTQRFSSLDIAEINKCDLVFLALPHGESGKIVKEIKSGIKIVDLGADFRLKSEGKWEQYYSGSYAGVWTYGMPELMDHQVISGATKVANPGCYATAIALSIAPALNFIDSTDITVVAASGTTGAGRSAKINLIGSEVMNNLSSYKFAGVHQHTPEIEQILEELAKKEVKISFTPILAPMPRGILATTTARLSESKTTEEIRKDFIEFYKNSRFVRILDDEFLPNTSAVLGTNHALIQVAIDPHVNRIVVSTVIDNLGKGAAGQAIQNANLMCGLPEDSGLTLMGVK
ncbi:MAG: N-acetyl-gamma-glutamyl-phosphate reductase [Candidatus Nanopelagicus sp.]